MTVDLRDDCRVHLKQESFPFLIFLNYNVTMGFFFIELHTVSLFIAYLQPWFRIWKRKPRGPEDSQLNKAKEPLPRTLKSMYAL